VDARRIAFKQADRQGGIAARDDKNLERRAIADYIRSGFFRRPRTSGDVSTARIRQVETTDSAANTVTKPKLTVS
jgi:hypothetical protein